MYESYFADRKNINSTFISIIPDSCLLFLFEVQDVGPIITVMLLWLLFFSRTLLMSTEMLSKVFLLEPRGLFCACPPEASSVPLRRELLLAPISFFSTGFSTCTARFIWRQSNNSARCLKMRFCLGGLKHFIMGKVRRCASKTAGEIKYYGWGKHWGAFSETKAIIVKPIVLEVPSPWSVRHRGGGEWSPYDPRGNSVLHRLHTQKSVEMKEAEPEPVPIIWQQSWRSQFIGGRQIWHPSTERVQEEDMGSCQACQLDLSAEQGYRAGHPQCYYMAHAGQPGDQPSQCGFVKGRTCLTSLTP